MDTLIFDGPTFQTWRKPDGTCYDVSKDVVNKASVADQAANALGANRTFLALGSPSNAQNAAQVKALTQQVNALIRFALQNFDGTN